MKTRLTKEAKSRIMGDAVSTAEAQSRYTEAIYKLEDWAKKKGFKKSFGNSWVKDTGKLSSPVNGIRMSVISENNGDVKWKPDFTGGKMVSIGDIGKVLETMKFKDIDEAYNAAEKIAADWEAFLKKYKISQFTKLITSRINR